MKKLEFHDPDISLPVIRRRATEELILLLSTLGEILATHGHALTWSRNFSSDTACWSSVARLKKAGLLVTQGRDGRQPVLKLTNEGRKGLPAVLQPERRWRRKWKGYWYILMYDVPEPEKAYRESLRRFLARLKLGCLQKSVWISPDDVRPQYDDLVQAAGIKNVSFLFESKSVLGRRSDEIVDTAWPFELLSRAQSAYCERCRENMRILGSKGFSREEVTEIAKDELEAYLTVMEPDPLLPRVLWPSSYRGEDAFNVHKQFAQVLARLV